MAKRRRKKRSKYKSGCSSWLSFNTVLVIALLLCVFAMTPFGKNTLQKMGIEAGNFYNSDRDAGGKDTDRETNENDESEKNYSQNLSSDTLGNLRFDFIDVDQADSTLVTTPNGSRILIDAGTRETASELAAFLEDCGVKTLDYLVLTHPHSDHIGGAEKVLDSFDVRNVIMPDAANTGSTFERTISAIQKEKQEGCKVFSAELGDVYTLDGCQMNILGPAIEDDENLNNASIVMTLVYRDFTALFTGDAEKESEKATLELGYDVDCDLYQVGHHGSSTSSCDEFLSAASPSFAIISCGKDNSYGHPHAAVTKALKDRNIEYYTTAQSGNITFVTDGKTHNIYTEN